jgi:hypothetical protein
LIIAVYNPEDFNCHDVFYDCDAIEVFNNSPSDFNVTWNFGSLGGVRNFLVLDDGMSVSQGDNVGSLISLDKKGQYLTKTKNQMIAKLQEDNLAMQDTINFLLGI